MLSASEVYVRMTRAIVRSYEESREESHEVRHTTSFTTSPPASLPPAFGSPPLPLLPLFAPPAFRPFAMASASFAASYPQPASTSHQTTVAFQPHVSLGVEGTKLVAVPKATVSTLAHRIRALASEAYRRDLTSPEIQFFYSERGVEGGVGATRARVWVIVCDEHVNIAPAPLKNRGAAGDGRDQAW
jgi:hypothetical protein